MPGWRKAKEEGEERDRVGERKKERERENTK